MSLKNITLQNFRNYKNLSLDIGERTVLFGKNAQGKTNILEAIYLLCTLKSFRSRDASLVYINEPYASIEGTTSNKLRVVLQKENEDIKKTAQKNGVKIQEKKFLESFQAILFSPEDVELIKASPGARRRHLDLFLCKLDPGYTEALLSFKKTLQQRNALLKNIKKGTAKEDDLSVWDEGFVKLGNYITEKRKEVIEKINGDIDGFYKKVSGSGEEVRMSYLKGYKENDLKEALSNSRRVDILCGTTRVGPHRGDIEFKKEGKEVREFGSRGEFRTVILALKLCEGKILEEILKADVTYLLDDVFSELDGDRRKALLDIIHDKQVIITTTELDHVEEEFIKSSEVYEVINGTCRRTDAKTERQN